MRDKFSIIKQLDTEKLNEKIADFVYENGHDPYIFVNNATLEELMKPCKQEMVFTSFDGKKTLYKGLICKYQGYRMFEDNDLEFGEIELR